MKENGRWKADGRDKKRGGGKGIERQKGNSSRPERRKEWKRTMKGGERVRGRGESGKDENLVEGNDEDTGGEETQARCECTR
jgi:hypothetical protein